MIPTALIGHGWWGRHMADRLQASDTFDLVGLAAPELEVAPTPDVELYDGFEAAIGDPRIEAVILTSPNDLHERHAVSAALAGKHVFCEKPLALDSLSARRIVEACANARRVLGIGHERRFEPAMQALAQMVADDALGTLMHVEAAFSHDKLAQLGIDNWRTRSSLAPAAGMTGMGIHLTDFMISMFGPVAQVQAVTANRSLGWETGDVVSVQLVFASGMTGTLSAILHTPHFMRFHVFGSLQWVEVRNETHPDTPGGKSHLSRAQTGHGVATQSFDWTDTVVANLEAFGQAIRGEAPYPFSPFEMVHNIEVLDAIVAAAQTGETVRL